MDTLRLNDPNDGILPEHREAMLDHLRVLYSKKFPWADEVAQDVCVRQHYKEIVEVMDMDLYRSELEGA